MKKLFGLVFGIALIVLISYLWMSRRGEFETAGDEEYQKGEYRNASIQYTRSLAKNQGGFKEERILFKLGNSYRQLGESQRAFDFYLKILRENEDSVYRDRIQAFLRSETKVIQAEASVGDVQLDLSFLQEKRELSLIEWKQRRDKIYKMMIQALAQNVRPDSYEMRQLYQEFSKTQESYFQQIERGVRELPKTQVRLEQKRVALVGLPENAASELMKEELPYHWIVDQNQYLTDLFDSREQNPLDAILVYSDRESLTNLVINLERLYEFHEKAKVFLLFDDNSQEELESRLRAQILRRAKIVRCSSPQDCTNNSRLLLQRRSLWQSGG